MVILIYHAERDAAMTARSDLEKGWTDTEEHHEVPLWYHVSCGTDE